jgi:urea transport system permease protein
VVRFSRSNKGSGKAHYIFSRIVLLKGLVAMELFISQLINGLSVSSMLFITALGLVIIFGLMDVVNMAHGEFIMLGAYVTYFVTTVFEASFILAMLLAFTFTALFGVLIEVTLIKKLYGKVAESLLVTFALSIILQQIVRMTLGPEDKFVGLPIEGSIDFAGIVVPLYNVFLIAIAVIIMLTTLALFYRTSFGMQLRAVTKNRNMAQCLGINTSRIDTLTFACGSGLAGLAGALIAPVKSVMPSMGASYIVDGFLTVVLGGFTSIAGTAASSVVVSESVTVMAGYISEITAKILVFLIIIILIRFKPEGLFTMERR